MNRHFEDARYYLKRAGETATRGVKAELEPVRERYRELIGDEEPEPSRVDRIRRDFEAFQARAEDGVRTAIRDARGRVREYRHGNA